MRSPFTFLPLLLLPLTVFLSFKESLRVKAVGDLPPLPLAGSSHQGTAEQGVASSSLIWVQLKQDGSHKKLAEGLELPIKTVLHHNGATKSHALAKGSWISLPALFKSHLESYSGPWIDAANLREEPPKTLAHSMNRTQREAREKRIFQSNQPLIWIQLAQTISYGDLANQLDMPPDTLSWINGDWRNEKPMVKGSWISLPQDWRSSVEHATALDLSTLRETPPKGLAFYNTVPQRGERVHTVRQGEQLASISAEGGYPLKKIYDLNPTLGNQDLGPGMKLKLPLIRPNSQQLAARPGVAGLAWPDQQMAGQQQELRFETRWSWPTRSGLVTSGYGWRWGRMHNGIDIADHVGTPVLAAADGEVRRAFWHQNGYGYLVELSHADGSRSRYAHNSRILVKAGQAVRRGQVISLMGCTGICTGPHLHFEIHPQGSGAANPLALLPPR